MPLLAGHDRTTVSENIRRLRHEGYEARQAVAIAYRKARETGEPTMTHDVTTPKLAGGRRSPSDVAHARGLALELRKGNELEAARHARELAGLRGHPEAWPVLYENELSTVATLGTLRAPSTSAAMTAPRAPAGAMTTFYDRHPKLVCTAVAAGALIGGLRLNARYPEGVSVGPLHAQASTWAGGLTLGLALWGKYTKRRRIARSAASATVGFALATGAGRVAGGAGGTGPRI